MVLARDSTSVGATVPVDRLTSSVSSGPNGFSQLVNQGLDICLVFPDVGPLEVWMSQFGTT